MTIFIATLSHKSEGTRRLVFDDDDLYNAKDFAQHLPSYMGKGYTLIDVAELTEQDLSGLVMELITL